MSRVRPTVAPSAPLVALLLLLRHPAAATEPPGPPHRLVLVSFDGAGGAEYARQREALSPDGFRRAEREGARAERLETVAPSLTAVVHASISTGALPQATGIVSNTFHPAGAPLKDRVSGFDVESEVETLWEAFARQGRRVAALCWPGVTGRTPRATTPVGMRWVEARAPGFLWSGPGPDATFPDAAIALPPEARSWSPPRLVRVDPPTGRDGEVLAPLTFVLLDTVDDGRREYDTLAALDREGALAGRLRPGTWTPLPERGGGTALRGRWVKLLKLAPDGSSLSLYVGSLGQTEAWPDDFRKTLDERCGFWPGEPDTELIEGPEHDAKSYLEMSDRLSSFLVAAYETAERRGDWDLLLAYQPVVDEVTHVLEPPEAGAPGADAARVERDAGAIREAWRIADLSAARYLRFLERGGDVLLLSDHGLSAVKRTVFPAELARRRGFVETEVVRGRTVVRPDSPTDVIASGGTALVVLNRAGAMPGGVLSPEKAAAVLADLASTFRALRDETGAPLFATVALRSEASAIGLDHPNAGDLVLLASPGTSLRNGFPKDGASAPVLLPPDVAGQHGYGADPDLDGIFFHAGPGIEPANLGIEKAVDVAARVAARFRLRPPGAR